MAAYSQVSKNRKAGNTVSTAFRRVVRPRGTARDASKSAIGVRSPGSDRRFASMKHTAPRPDVTRLLAAWSNGDKAALVNEAYLRLADQKGGNWSASRSSSDSRHT